MWLFYLLEDRRNNRQQTAAALNNQVVLHTVADAEIPAVCIPAVEWENRQNCREDIPDLPDSLMVAADRQTLDS